MAEVASRSVSGERAAVSRAAPKRAGNGWLTGITIAATLVVGFTLGVMPWVGGVVTHLIERVSNHFKAKKELDARADWYRDQIANTLGISPAKVKGRHLVQAAAINPTLAAAVKDINRTESSENKSSIMINAAASMIPVVGQAGKEVVGVAKAITTGAKMAHLGKTIAATTAGGLLASWTDKEHLSAQEVIEGISSQLEAADAQGIDPKTVITPQMVFMLRVAQDEALGKEIAQNFKKPFNKMNEAEQTQVMQQYTPLANAAASEAHALANKLLPPQELMARAPNLNGTAKYVIGQKAATFTGRLADGRTNNVAMVRGRAANDGSYAAAEDARRLAAAQAINARQA